MTDRQSGLYLRGRLWWVRRVRSPLTGKTAALSAGTPSLARATRMKMMLEQLTETRAQWEWLELLVAGEPPLSLSEVYDNYAASTLHVLREQRTPPPPPVVDVDLEPWVKRWDEEHQAVRVQADEISEDRRQLALRYVRAFIPEGKPFPRANFTEDGIKASMAKIRHPKTGAALSGPTLRKYVDALATFYKYVRKPNRGDLSVNPFEDANWIPANSAARTVAWEFEQSTATLDRMTGDRRAYMALVLGSGVEEGAATAMRGRDVGPGGDDAGRWVIAHATVSRATDAAKKKGGKNTARDQRKIFVRKWAWDIFFPHAKTVLPTASLWQTINPKNRGREIRDSFYQAQVAAGLLEKPTRSKKTGKLAWKAVDPHRIHDARHTYINITSLGLDGERRLSKVEQQYQLGHGDGTMIDKVYGKLNLEQRLRQIELAEARAKGRAEAERSKVGKSRRRVGI